MLSVWSFPSCSSRYLSMSAWELTIQVGIFVASFTFSLYPSFRALPTSLSLLPPWYP